VYHYIQWKNLISDFVDITGFTDKKIESILAYSSQFYDPNIKGAWIIHQTSWESLNYRPET
jgi:hypothetical protein